MAELGAHEFALTAPEDVPRKPTRRRARPGEYREADHQFLINELNRYLTLAEFGRIRRRAPYFKDYPALLRAAIMYFGIVELGWSARKAQKPLRIEREYITRWIRLIEDARADGDVFDRITLVVKGYRNGL